MMNWDEVMGLLAESGYEGKKTGFEDLRGILAVLGSPQDRLSIVHVAGTNGKGSASRMMQSVLTAAGYRTGLFISPHLEFMNERWTIDGERISDAALQETAERVRRAVEWYNAGLTSPAPGGAEGSSPGWGRISGTQPVESSAHSRSGGQKAEFSDGIRSSAAPAAGEAMDALPQQNCRTSEVRPVAFALLTMMAFDYFSRQDCDIAVLEVGIGGRMDSTNVIPTPELAMIMNLGLEHTELLGDTLEEIAFEKGGIIKPGGRVVLYHQSEEAEGVIRKLCCERGAELVVTCPEDLELTGEPVPEVGSSQRRAAAPETGPSCSYHSHQALHLRLAGRYQRWNMLAVLDGIDLMRRHGRLIPEEAVHRGMETVTWPGRFEIVSRDPLVIVDGAHNPNGIEALIQNMEDPDGPLFRRTATAGPGGEAGTERYQLLFVFGAMADKDVPRMLRLLAPYAAGFIMETVPGEITRAEAASRLAEEARSGYSGPVRTAPSIRAALDLAVASAGADTAILCCGSLYQVADIRRYFGIQ